MSQAARRSESPPQKLPLCNDSFEFRTKLEEMSPNYNNEEVNPSCEGMIATVTMTAAPRGRSTPNESHMREDASPTTTAGGKDIPIKVEHLLGSST